MINEYDAPLNNCYNNEEAFIYIKKILSAVFGRGLKNNTFVWKCVITGIL